MVVNQQEITKQYAIYNGDCIEVLQTLPSERVHLSIYSPPFASGGSGALYVYSSSEKDLSNCADYDAFFDHYDFVITEIHRVTVPGRMTAVHCTDIPSGNSGKDYRIDFPGDIVRQHCQCRNPKCDASPRRKAIGLCGHGWFDLVGKYDIWKEPLGVRNRTMAKNLAHKTIVTDSSLCSSAAADYLLVFRRKGENPVPIAHPHGLMNYAGEREMPAELLRYKGWKGNQIENRYSHWIWRQYASAFWDDIRIGRVLPFREARDEEDEKHVHALQLDVIERCVHLWSSPGETVLTPFMGVGSEVYVAVANGRRALGVELKPSYYIQSKRNLDAGVASGWNDSDGQGDLLEGLEDDPNDNIDILAETEPVSAEVSPSDW